MTPLRFRRLLAVLLVTAVVAWAVLRVLASRGVVVPGPPWTTAVVELLTAVFVLGAAWPVRQWVRGRRERRVEPVAAARAFVLATAAAWTGSVLAGVFLAIVVLALPDLPVEAAVARALGAGAAGLAAVGVVAAALVAERWCRVPPDDDERALPAQRRER